MRSKNSQQKKIRERKIPAFKDEIAARQADIRQLVADKLRLDPSPPSIPRGRSRLGAIATAIANAIANAIAAAIQADNQAKQRRINAQIESIKGEIEGLKSKIVGLKDKWRDFDFLIEQHFRERDQRGCPHVDMAFFVC